MITPPTRLRPTRVMPRLRSAASQDSAGGLSVLPSAPERAVFGLVELLTDATELLPALLEAIHEAKTSLKVDAALLAGAQGRQLRSQLARRSRQGVRVQVLAHGASPAALAEVRAEGLAVRSGARPALAAAGGCLVVDDRLALVAPPALTDGARWARVGLLRLTGEAAGELGRQFNHDWAEAGGQPIPLAAFGQLSRHTAAEQLSAIQVGGVGPQRKAGRQLLVQALAQAQSQIDLMADAVTDPAVVDALLAAQRRGVTVRVLLGGYPGWDAPAQAGVNAELLAAGVALRRYQREGTAQPLALRLALVDARTLAFGQAPWTQAALAAGGVVVEARGGRELALVRAIFFHDWSHARPAARPSAAARLRSALHPVGERLGQTAEPFASLLASRVGLAREPGGAWRFVSLDR